MGALRRIVFVRSAPLNVTPAVERYVRCLRRLDPAVEVVGVELDYGQPRPPVAFVDRLVTRRASFQGTARRAVALAGWQASLAWSLLRLRPDAVQFCDVFSALPALLAKLLLRCRLVFDIRDVVALSVGHRGSLLASALGALEGLAAVASDEVVVVDVPLVEFLPRRVRAGARVIPNTPQVDPHREPAFSADGLLRVSLSGFVSHRRNLEAWCALAAEDPALRLEVFGTVADDATRRILDRRGLGAVERVPHREALDRTARCDAIGLMYDPSIGINVHAAPNKYYEGLMLGKPIVCAEGMLLSREVAGWGAGIVAPYGDVAALRSAVAVLRDPEERRRMGANARRLFLEVYAGRAERGMEELYAKLGFAR